jgi:(S)-2-hydroxyglutarate dehydrogenase
VSAIRKRARAYDVAVVGGGILGLATGMALLERRKALRLVILDKEKDIGMHQTSHNSGVIHMGIYYRPGSMKAKLCVEGARRMMEFCDVHGIRYERCGKVIVATSEQELERLETLYQRGLANRVPELRRIDAGELREIEPHAAGLAAVHSPCTAIVDYSEVAHAMARDVEEYGAEIRTGAEVVAVHSDRESLRVETKAGALAARSLINCAGLYADRLARRMGVQTDVQIVPFRGEYYLLRAERRDIVRGLVYPVPDPDLPFLGVHFTKTIHGETEAGPNAVLAFAREGYTKRTIVATELWETLRYRGFHALARRYWRVGLYETYRSFSKAAFTRSLQRLIPDILAADLRVGGAGVRAQAVASDGSLLDDFSIIETPRAMHVLNAPSPAATAALAIGDHIAERAMETLSLQA